MTPQQPRPPMEWDHKLGEAHSSAAHIAAHIAAEHLAGVNFKPYATFVVTTGAWGWCLGAVTPSGVTLSEHQEALEMMRDYIDSCITLTESGLPATSLDPRLDHEKR